MARAGVGSLDASSATGIQRRVSTQELTRSNLTCLLAQDGPMTHRTNTDQFTYLPGRYFACALRTRFSLSFGHKWVAEILSLSGVNRPSGPLLYGASPVGTCVEITW